MRNSVAKTRLTVMEGWTLLYKFVPICHRNFEVHLRNLNLISILIYLNNYHLPLLILVKANQTLACSFRSVLFIFRTNLEPSLNLTETKIVKIPQKYSQFFLGIYYSVTHHHECCVLRDTNEIIMIITDDLGILNDRIDLLFTGNTPSITTSWYHTI